MIVPVPLRCCPPHGELKKGHVHAVCKYARNPWCQLTLDGYLLALTASGITPKSTGHFYPEAAIRKQR